MGHSQLAKFQLADLYVGDLPMIERVHLDDSTDEEEDEAESSGAESEYDEDGVKILKVVVPFMLAVLPLLGTVLTFVGGHYSPTRNRERLNLPRGRREVK